MHLVITRSMRLTSCPDSNKAASELARAAAPLVRVEVAAERGEVRSLQLSASGAQAGARVGAEVTKLT